jgi:hypothetical protein
MARFTVAAAIMALASMVSAQTPGFDAIIKPDNGEKVPAGTTYTIKWTAAPTYTGKVTLGLIGGQTQGTQTPLYTIGSADNAAGQLDWKVDCAYSGLPFYGLTITAATDSTIFQYSNPFQIVDSDACSKSTGSTSSTSSAASGTVTATLSSVYGQSTTTVTNATVTTTSCPTSAYPTSTVAPNYNNTMTTISKTPVVVTATSYTPANGTVVPSSRPTVVTASGATRVGGSIVMLAGVAAAFFVL